MAEQWVGDIFFTDAAAGYLVIKFVQIKQIIVQI